MELVDVRESCGLLEPPRPTVAAPISTSRHGQNLQHLQTVWSLLKLLYPHIVSNTMKRIGHEHPQIFCSYLQHLHFPSKNCLFEGLEALSVPCSDEPHILETTETQQKYRSFYLCFGILTCIVSLILGTDLQSSAFLAGSSS